MAIKFNPDNMYEANEPCPSGHVPYRYIKNKQCVQCSRENNKRNKNIGKAPSLQNEIEKFFERHCDILSPPIEYKITTHKLKRKPKPKGRPRKQQ